MLLGLFELSALLPEALELVEFNVGSLVLAPVGGELELLGIGLAAAGSGGAAAVIGGEVGESLCE